MGGTVGVTNAAGPAADHAPAGQRTAPTRPPGYAAGVLRRVADRLIDVARRTRRGRRIVGLALAPYVATFALLGAAALRFDLYSDEETPVHVRLSYWSSSAVPGEVQIDTCGILPRTAAVDRRHWSWDSPRHLVRLSRFCLPTTADDGSPRMRVEYHLEVDGWFMLAAVAPASVFWLAVGLWRGGRDGGGEERFPRLAAARRWARPWVWTAAAVGVALNWAPETWTEGGSVELCRANGHPAAAVWTPDEYQKWSLGRRLLRLNWDERVQTPGDDRLGPDAVRIIGCPWRGFGVARSVGRFELIEPERHSYGYDDLWPYGEWDRTAVFLPVWALAVPPGLANLWTLIAAWRRRGAADDRPPN